MDCLFLTGLHYYGARYLDSRLSTWFGVDPLADAPANIGTSPYAYVWNNPIKYNDPDGRCPICPFIVLGLLMLESHPASTPGSDKDHVTIKQAQDDYNKSQLFSLIPGGKQTKASQVVAGRVVNEVRNEVKDEFVKRSGAFNEAKRDLKIPKSQHPDKASNGKQFESVPMTDMNGKSILGNDGKPIMTREYTYTKPDGNKAVIQDHSAGHAQFGGEASKPHFNVRPSGNTRTGTVSGTKSHYPFLNFLNN